jgi:hypothetical protein
MDLSRPVGELSTTASGEHTARSRTCVAAGILVRHGDAPVVRRIGGASGGANQRVCVALWARLLRQRARAGLGRRDAVSRENGGIEP